MDSMTMMNHSTDVMISTTTNVTTTTMSADARGRLLGAVNLKETIKHAPVLAFYIFIMITGLIGNAFVLYIYKMKFKRTSARTYILCLALLDFLVCCVGLPYHTLDLTHLLIYHHTEVCRALSYLSGAVNLGSVFVLMVVAVDRYLKVCRPLKKQVVDFGNRRACAIALIVAIIFSIPNAILYGESSVEIEHENITLTGVECFIDDSFAETTFAVAYLGFYILVFIICVFTLIVLYTFICREIYRNQAFQTKDISSQGNCFNCTSANDNNSDSDSDCSGEGGCPTTTMSEVVTEDGREEVVPMDVIKEEHEKDEQTTDKETAISKSDNEVDNGDASKALLKDPDHVKTRESSRTGPPSSKKRSRREEPRKPSKHKSVRPVKSNVLVRHTTKGTGEKHTRKITLMMLTITVVFIISYLPFIVISLADSSDADYWKDMSPQMAVFVDFMLRFYLINNMANAIIYSFWDERFRRECILIITKLFFCCRSLSTKRRK